MMIFNYDYRAMRDVEGHSRQAVILRRLKDRHKKTKWMMKEKSDDHDTEV